MEPRKEDDATLLSGREPPLLRGLGEMHGEEHAAGIVRWGTRGWEVGSGEHTGGERTGEAHGWEARGGGAQARSA